MKRVIGLLAVSACLSITASVAGQDPRPFCDPKGPTLCVPDSLSVVFPPDGSPVDDGTPADTSKMVSAVGEEVSVRIVFIAQSELIQGWSYGFRSDPDFMTLMDGTVTTAGTRADPTHPDGIAIQPMFDVTQAVREQDKDPKEGPFVGFISATEAVIEESSKARRLNEPGFADRVGFLCFSGENPFGGFSRASSEPDSSGLNEDVRKRERKEVG